LVAAFDLQVLWNEPGQQATVLAESTPSTLSQAKATTDTTTRPTKTAP
jgi:hypothetical protein